MCRTVADLDITPGDPTGRVTISMGVASYPADALASEGLIRCADRAMYTAKAKGKNQVQLYGANRRALPRVQVEVEGEIRVLEAKRLPFYTLDISERGLRFKADESLPLNSMVEFVLRIPGQGDGIKAHGRVVRIHDMEDGGYQMALTIMDIDRREYVALTRYLRAQTSAAGSEAG